MQKEYVVGFPFSDDKELVMLLRKNKPDFQAGRLNGVGGKVEEFDRLRNAKSIRVNAMEREWLEESRGLIGPLDWKWFVTFQGNNSIVHAFKAFADTDTLMKLHGEKNDTGEVFVGFLTDFITSRPNAEANRLMPNLSWLLPMALDDDIVGGSVDFT